MTTHDYSIYMLPDKGFLRINDVLRVIPVSKSTWWAGVKSGRYPAPVKLSERTTAWQAESIHELIATLGKTKEAQ